MCASSKTIRRSQARCRKVSAASAGDDISGIPSSGTSRTLKLVMKAESDGFVAAQPKGLKNETAQQNKRKHNSLA